MDEKPQSSVRLVELSEAAVFDLAGIDNATAHQWGEAQANRHIAYIREVMASLAAKPSLGVPIKDRQGFLVYLAKYRKRRSAHGHRIFYTETEQGILVVRILHTAMNWVDHLD